MDGVRILIVDDDHDILGFLERVLMKEGFETSLFSDPLEVLKSINDIDYQLAILDISMPNLDGIELAIRMRMIKDLPFIFLSAHHQQRLADRAGKIGSATYLVKPVRREQLVATVRQVLGLPKKQETDKPAIRNRYIMERAKGIYQGKYNLSENSAIQRIREEAQDKSLTIEDLCQRIVEGQDILAQFLERDV